MDKKKPEHKISIRNSTSEFLIFTKQEGEKSNIPMTMEDWAIQLDKLLELDARDILKDAGKISAKIAKDHAESEFEKYLVTQGSLFESDFDREVKAITENATQ